jgi:hypothetical protein
MRSNRASGVRAGTRAGNFERRIAGRRKPLPSGEAGCSISVVTTWAPEGESGLPAIEIRAGKPVLFSVETNVY